MWISLVAHFTLKEIYQEICSINVAQPIVTSIIAFPHQVHPGGPFCSHLQLWGKFSEFAGIQSVQFKVFFFFFCYFALSLFSRHISSLDTHKNFWFISKPTDFLYENCSLNSQFSCSLHRVLSELNSSQSLCAKTRKKEEDMNWNIFVDAYTYTSYTHIHIKSNPICHSLHFPLSVDTFSTHQLVCGPHTTGNSTQVGTQLLLISFWATAVLQSVSGLLMLGIACFQSCCFFVCLFFDVLFTSFSLSWYPPTEMLHFLKTPSLFNSKDRSYVLFSVRLNCS